MQLRFALKNWPHWLRRVAYGGAGGRIRVGPHTYGAPRVRWWGEPADLSIGGYCSIADDVQIFLGGNHRTDWVTTYPFPVMRRWREARAIRGHPATRGDVRIGNDVWLGSGCVILSGVTIGHGAVVGCRAVVGRDVPDYAIVTGNPASVARLRFPSEQVARLLRSAWWDWPEARIRRCLPLLLAGDVEAFLRAAEAGDSGSHAPAEASR